MTRPAQEPRVGIVTDGGRFDEDVTTALVDGDPVATTQDGSTVHVDEAHVRWVRWGGPAYPWELGRLVLRGRVGENADARSEVELLTLDEAPEWLRTWAVVRRPV